jgi:PTH1 family peptidyl-tRNA hydrolase
VVTKETPVNVVVGLGNPGLEYAHTRHNVGFRVVDEIARRYNWRYERQKGRYLWAEGPAAAGPLILLKPLTYMNRSGEALRGWAARQGVRLTGAADADGLAPIVICDDLALPLGSLRIRARGCSGGQKGLESIIRVLGGDMFPRIRLGIAGREGPIPPEQWSDYVLEPFQPEERDAVAELVAYAVEALECLLAEGAQAAASRYNRRPAPPAE